MKTILTTIILLFATMVSGSEIYDNAGLFSETAKAKVVQQLREVQSKAGLETIIETIPEAQTNFSSTHEKEKYFESLIVEKATERNATGIYVLVCKKPGRVQVDFHRQVAGSQSDKVKIRDAGIAGFKNKDFDGGSGGDFGGSSDFGGGSGGDF